MKMAADQQTVLRRRRTAERREEGRNEQELTLLAGLPTEAVFFEGPLAPPEEGRGDILMSKSGVGSRVQSTGCDQEQ